MSFKEAYTNFQKFKKELDEIPERIIQAHKPELVELVKDQLYSGLNGNDKALTPSYLNDPFFNTPEAGQWRGRASAYAKWKYLQTPPRGSSAGHPPRKFETPNLTIIYVFYDSITAVNIEKGVRIGSNTPLGSDIEQKYGSVIFKIGNISKAYFINHIFKPYWKYFLDKYRR